MIRARLAACCHINPFHSSMLCLVVLTLAGCGYRVAGHADLLPKRIHTIAIPPFGNATTRFKLAEKMAAALTREFLTRTRYDVIADVNRSDAVLTGAVVNYAAYPTVFDPITNRATSVQLSVYLQVTLTDRSDGKVLFSRPNFEVRERYEISVSPAAYLDESEMAMDRVSRDAARAIVSAVLENF